MTVTDTKQCPYCAETIKKQAVFCRFCGHDLRTGQLSKTTGVSQPQRMWSPGTAAVLSLIIPGAGQMYKGQVGTGFLHLVVVVIGYALFVIPGLILHVLCIIDATQGDPYNGSGTNQKAEMKKKSNSSDFILVIILGAIFGAVGLCALLVFYVFILV